jgi:hypothetical protein
VQTQFQLRNQGKLALISGLVLAGAMLPAAQPSAAPLGKSASLLPQPSATDVIAYGPVAPLQLLDPAPWPDTNVMPLLDIAPLPPAALPAAVVLGAPACAFGAGSSLGLTSNADSVYRAVCSAFPAVGPYGGLRAGDWGDHGTGNAIDIMCDSGSGDAIADFILAHAAEFNVNYVIWKQRIAYPGGGWSFMEDRGSATANHYDHVHVSVY